MRLPAGVWTAAVAAATVAALFSAARRDAAVTGVIGERAEAAERTPPAAKARLPAALEAAAAEIERRLQDQPDVRSARVRVEVERDGSSPSVDIYIHWDMNGGPPEPRMWTVAAWAATVAGEVTEVVVRDSAGRSCRWSGADVARR
jgi:hypothetical protein